jgi:hypothetical protein
MGHGKEHDARQRNCVERGKSHILLDGDAGDRHDRHHEHRHHKQQPLAILPLIKHLDQEENEAADEQHD